MASYNAQIPIDQSYTDGQGGDDAVSFSSARSVASLITRYRYENGRRYHAYRDGQYYMPNDDKHNEYEMVVHHLWLLTLHDQLYLAPIEHPLRVLDAGTGTGLWAIDMADRFPAAEVIGTDLSPTQIKHVPPNVRFEVDDFCSEWTYPANTFDFIHLRTLVGSASDWPALYRQCYRHLQPNGYIEHAEVDIHMYHSTDPPSPLPPANPIAGLIAGCAEAGERTGKSMYVARHIADRLRDVGFVDVTEHIYKWPIGPWSSDPKLKQVGQWNQRNWEDGCEDWILALYTRVLGYTYDEVQEVTRQVRRAARDRKEHIYHNVHVVHARKPAPPSRGPT